MSDTSICVVCTSPCASCSITKTNCTSCILNLNVFYTPYKCVDSLSCPAATYPNYSTFICDICVFPCSTCNSATNCLTCVTNYNLQGSICTSVCSIGYVAINSTCFICTANCSSCYLLQTNCTSCITSNPILFLTNNKCVTT